MALTRALAEETRSFNIPAQPLGSAIDSLAKQVGLHVFYADDAVQGRESTAVQGIYTPKQALGQLLEGSGVKAVSTGENAFALKAATGLIKTTAEANEGETLPKVTVEADSAYDPECYADPYNKDYVIPNAAAGTKTDTPIMGTPLNVQVISKQALKDQQVIRLADSLRNVSGVTARTNTTGSIPGAFWGELPNYLFARL